jgi:hypothetical protein
MEVLRISSPDVGDEVTLTVGNLLAFPRTAII